ncbi:hypothetical protein JW933_08635, partial [candidate division FCPU426 bacterium]|nr:hypothetical protein [candidate division FCPU426 bacterium]
MGEFKMVVERFEENQKKIIEVMNHRFDNVQKDIGVLKQDVGVLKQDVGVLKQDVGVLKQDVG